MSGVHVSRSFFKMVCTCMFVEHSFRWVRICKTLFKMGIHLWNSIQDVYPFME